LRDNIPYGNGNNPERSSLPYYIFSKESGYPHIPV
jgi:hypothetical protein